MARAAVYEPRLVELLKERTGGITTSDLAREAGCSRQQVYKVLNKPTVTTKVLGKTPTGAELLTWSDEAEVKATKTTTGNLPTMNAIFHIVAMTKIDGKVLVTLEDDEGHRIESEMG